jgi:pimeloyl-ACP methyl ester carboxylesterase
MLRTKRFQGVSNAERLNNSPPPATIPLNHTTQMNKSFSTMALCLCFIAALAGCKTGSPATASHHPTYVLVHGAFGGGWDWRHVDDLLTADGNTVFRPTLTGQGEHANLSSTNIDLDTHIQDIVNVILWENLHDIVLVGHSYGGMVITGVADRLPGRIKHLVYIDALLPENGECAENCRKNWTPKTPNLYANGYVVPTWLHGNPPPPHDVLMPAKTLTEPITLTNQALALKIPATYILTVDAGKPPEQDDFYRCYQRAQARGWPAWIMEGDHNVQRSHPKELVKLIEQAL